MSGSALPNTGTTGRIAAHASWDAEMNRNLLDYDALHMCTVKDKDLTAPPGSPADGDRYLIVGSGSGAWTGKEFAYWDATAAGWKFITPKNGWILYVLDESKFYVRSGGTWTALATGGGGGGSPHALLDGSQNNDTDAGTPTRGDMIYVGSDGKWARLPKGTAGQLLKSDGTDLSWATVSASPHALLDGAGNSDTTAGTVARGDLVTGQGATPTWKRLAKGTSGQVLTSDGTDLAWQTPSSAPHALLDASQNSDTDAGSPTRGDIIYVGADGKWARLPKGTSGQLLKSDGTDIGWATVSASPHALLDGSANNDTDAGTPTRGDIIYVGADGKWARLPKGTAGQLLKSDGTDVSWATVSASPHALLDGAGNSDTTAGTVARGDLVTGQGATPTWKRLAKGTAGQVLKSDGTDLLWGSTPAATGQTIDKFFADTDFDHGGVTEQERSAGSDTAYHGLSYSGSADTEYVAYWVVPRDFVSLTSLKVLYTNGGGTSTNNLVWRIGAKVMGDGTGGRSAFAVADTTIAGTAVADQLKLLAVTAPTFTWTPGDIVAIMVERRAISDGADVNFDTMLLQGLLLTYSN